MRRRVAISPELKANIALQNKANRIAEVKSRKPRAVQRAEANAVRRELKHDAGMSSKRRSRAEQLRQAALTVQREAIARRKRVAELLQGVDPHERKTDTGIVIPAGPSIGEILSRVRE